MKKALIIGITGQDGGLLAKYLLDRGYQVSGTSRDTQVTSRKNLLRLNIANRVHLCSEEKREQ